MGRGAAGQARAGGGHACLGTGTDQELGPGGGPLRLGYWHQATCVLPPRREDTRARRRTMTPSATSTAPAAGTAPRIGFAAQVDHTGVEVDAGPPSSSGLRAGTELFTAAERLGYDVGYVRTRHLQDALSSPLLFLAALGQSVQRMQLGT